METSILCVADVARRYAVTPSTVVRWCDRGLITYHCLRDKDGKRRRHIWFLSTDLEAFEADHQVSAVRQGRVLVPYECGSTLLTPRQVAQRHGVHLTTVLRWCEHGHIEHLDFSRRAGGKRTIRFHQDYLSRFDAKTVVRATSSLRPEAG